jgi:hypothetical protein
MRDFCKYQNNYYIIKPFTIDNTDTRVREDGFSVTVDNEGRPSLNIHVSLISLEYLKKGYVISSLRKEMKTNKVAPHLCRKTIAAYSLQPGLRKVLTLSIKRTAVGYNYYYATCEEIMLTQNYAFRDKTIDTRFYYVFNKILTQFPNISNERVVDYLMCCYSLVFSKFLHLNMVEYVKGNKLSHNEEYQKAKFTTPIRQSESLFNQFILLQYLWQYYKKMGIRKPLTTELFSNDDIKTVEKERMKILSLK